MAYGRTLRVVAGGVTLVNCQGVADDTLNCHFEIHQATVQSPNTCTLRVHNPAPGTAHAVPDGVQQHGTLQVYAGYQDEGAGLIFQGDIKQRRIGKENNVTTYVEVLAADGDQAYNLGAVSKSVPAGGSPQQHVDAAVQAMGQYGVTLGYVTQGLLSTPTYQRGQVLFALARDVLRNVAKTKDAEWSVQNGQVEIVGRQDSKPGVIIVNENTGMVGMAQETPNGIRVRTLLNYRVAVNSSIQLNEASIQRASYSLDAGGSAAVSQANLGLLGTGDGTYKVVAVDRTGTLRGDEWYNDIICVGATNGLTAPVTTQFLPALPGAGTAAVGAPAAPAAGTGAPPAYGTGNPAGTPNPTGG